jgi:hypothetical protein
MRNPIAQFNELNSVYRVTGIGAEPVTLVISYPSNTVRVFVWDSTTPLASVRGVYQNYDETGLDAGIRALLSERYGTALGFNFNVSAGLGALGEYAREFGVTVERVTLAGDIYVVGGWR